MRLVSILAAVLLTHCTGDDRPPPAADFDAGPVGVDRAATDVRRPGLDVSPVDPCTLGPCGAEERCGPPRENGMPGSGNGVDDNCDGRVDEGCPCVPGEARACFNAAPDRRGIGACRDGMMVCTELGAWQGNECNGATLPAEETCNGRDDDCDGATDEGLAMCASALVCPASVAVNPLAELRVDGRAIDPMARGFAWRLECPAGLDPCPAIAAPTADALAVTLVRAGRYVAEVDVTRAGGAVERCRFPVYVQGRGLRIELDWDRKGGVGAPGADIDLHVAPIDRRRAQTARWFTADDCYFQTCKAPGGTVVWSVGMTDTRFAPTMGAGLCENSPPPFGEAWRTSGRCWNPRLDVDTITCDPALRDSRDPRYCFPENISVDEPPEGVVFRAMVNYYRDQGLCTDGDATNDVVHPVVAFHCGGITRAVVGSVDDGLVPMRCQDNPSVGSGNFSWIAADVRVFTNACGVRDCEVTPLRARANQFASCTGLDAARDVCQDAQGRVFVRRSGGRAVNIEFAANP